MSTDVALANEQLRDLIGVCRGFMANRHGWKSELAEVMGLHPSTFSRVLAKSRDLQLGTILEIGARIGVPSSFFTDPMSESTPHAHEAVLDSKQLSLVIGEPSAQDIAPPHPTNREPKLILSRTAAGVPNIVIRMVESNLQPLRTIASAVFVDDGHEVTVDLGMADDLVRGLLASSLVVNATRLREKIERMRTANPEASGDDLSARDTHELAEIVLEILKLTDPEPVSKPST